MIASLHLIRTDDELILFLYFYIFIAVFSFHFIWHKLSTLTVQQFFEPNELHLN